MKPRAFGGEEDGAQKVVEVFGWTWSPSWVPIGWDECALARIRSKCNEIPPRAEGKKAEIWAFEWPFTAFVTAFFPGHKNRGKVKLSVWGVKA